MSSLKRKAPAAATASAANSSSHLRKQQRTELLKAAPKPAARRKPQAEEEEQEEQEDEADEEHPAEDLGDLEQLGACMRRVNSTSAALREDCSGLAQGLDSAAHRFATCVDVLRTLFELCLISLRAAALESSIVGDGSSTNEDTIAPHFNSLVKMIHMAAKATTTSNPDALAIAISAVQGQMRGKIQLSVMYEVTSSYADVDAHPYAVALFTAVVRIFTQWMATGQFLNSKTASKKKDKSAVLRTLEGLLQQQYKKLWSILFELLQSAPAVVQSNALHAAMDLVQAEGSSIAAASATPAASVPDTLANGSFASILRCIFFSGADETSQALRTELNDTFLRAHADLRLAALREMKTLVHLPPAEFKSLMTQWQGSAPSRFVENTVEFLLRTDWTASVSKNWVILPADEDEDLMGMSSSLPASPALLNKLLGESWLGLLRQKLSVEMYKEILVSAHTAIIPVLPSPLALADFLTDSYNIGGIVSLLSLNALFILISKYNLVSAPRFDASARTKCFSRNSHGFSFLISLLLLCRTIPPFSRNCTLVVAPSFSMPATVPVSSSWFLSFSRAIICLPTSCVHSSNDLQD
jgi:hypothetical protein